MNTSRLHKYDLRGQPINRDLFESKFVKLDGCWIWKNGKNNIGYGSFGLRLAHRVSYELYIGPIPDNMQVCHSCDNRACVNPDHLWLGTGSQNMLDCKAKGRMSLPPKFIGSAHPESKLKEYQVRDIRILHQMFMSKRELARQYGIDRQTLNSIISRVTWRHV